MTSGSVRRAIFATESKSSRLWSEGPLILSKLMTLLLPFLFLWVANHCVCPRKKRNVHCVAPRSSIPENRPNLIPCFGVVRSGFRLAGSTDRYADGSGLPKQSQHRARSLIFTNFAFVAH